MKPTKHVCKWRELPTRAGQPWRDGTIVYCVTDAEENAQRLEREGKPRPRSPKTDHVEFLTPRAAREFRRQRRLGLEPHFDSEGLVPIVVQTRSGASRADRRRETSK